MPCTNCRRIWRQTGVRPQHYNQGNIATCPEPHHHNCLCSTCRDFRVIRTRDTITHNTPIINEAPAPPPTTPPPPTRPTTPPPPPRHGRQRHVVVEPRPTTPPPTTSTNTSIIQFQAPTSTNPRCSELASECPVCMTDFDDNHSSVNTSCGHKICLACFTTMLVVNLRKSFNTKAICPICRTVVVEKA